MANGLTETKAKAIFEARCSIDNHSISANWSWDDVKRDGWFGFRTGGSQPVIAGSYHKKRTRWHYCDGYSS